MSAILQSTSLWPNVRFLRGDALADARIVKIDPIILVAAILLNILGLALPLVTLHVYDKVLPNQAVETLIVMTLGLVAIAFLEFALRALQSLVMAPSATFFARRLKEEALARYLARPVPEGGPSAMSSEVLDQLGMIDRFAAFFGGTARQALIDLPFALIALVVIAAIGGPLAIAPLICLIVYLAVLRRLGAQLAEESRERRKGDTKSADFLTEAFSSILTIKSFGLEGVVLRRFDRLLTASVDTHRNILGVSGGVQRFSGVFGNLSTIVTLAAGAALAIAGEMTIGAVAACTLLAGRAVQPAVRAAKAWNEVQRARIAAEDVQKLFESLPRTRRVDVVPATAPTIEIVDAETRIDVPAGAAVLLVEGSSVQRTVLLEAVAGLRDRAGTTLDGMAPNDYRRASEGSVVFVGRDVVPFRGTILDNLTVFGRRCSAQAALDVSVAIGLDGHVRKLPNGYDTALGASISDGVVISTLAQIALVRALAQKPRLLVLDEPTARLDARDAAKAMAQLKAAHWPCTIVASGQDDGGAGLFTHRLTMAPTGGLALSSTRAAEPA